jgi:anti-sigma factor RsiW
MHLRGARVSDHKIERCQECVDLLGDYLDGALPPDRASALEKHLSMCMPCITFVRTYKATSHVCRKSLEREMPEELVATLEQFLASQIPGFCEGAEASREAATVQAPAPANQASAKGRKSY